MAIKKSLGVATKTKKAVLQKKEPRISTNKKNIKKTVTKKMITTIFAKKKQLVMASGETCFWVNNGPTLCSLKDMRDALRVMSNEQFIHHTGMGRNDFSLWVADVLGDKPCAAELSKAKNIKEALTVTEKYLTTYKK